MSRYYQRPENALKKANEFIEVGKPTRALDTLYDVIKGKKHRAFSEKVIEPIMLKYLELCVELKKPHTAKEGLYQYRLMCQSVNVGLLEKVIRSFIRMAEEKTEAARDALKKEVVEQSQEAIVEVDDLDNLSMSEMTLLNVITEEQAQERSDRAALIPWVKFLWESYTQCLDLLRNNARLENLYHDIAQMAFKFCLSYSRKTEFRKLCERLRKHFDDIVTRQGSQMNSIDFSSPETQQLNMETRLSQLDSAITMELWQEAYKAIEDIHLLMNQSKKSQTRMMAYYYQKLSLVFWKAGNLLFHAATQLKYYLLCKDMKKNVSADELQKNASQVSIATLAIPFPVQHPEFERFVETDKGMMEKSQKLANLLFLPQPPTRASLIRDLIRYGVLNNSIQPVQELYEVIETQFNPLDLCTQVDCVLKNCAAVFEDHEYLEQYVEPIQDVTLGRLIKQISQVYQSIDYDHLLSMTVFASQTRMEQLLVDAVRFNDMQINIDHRLNCVKFGTSLAEASREDVPEGLQLQAMPSEAVRLQLVNIMNYVDEAMEMIAPPHIQAAEDQILEKIYKHWEKSHEMSHIALLQRQKIIADRREELEQDAVKRDNEEKWRNEQLMKQQQILEAKRIEVEREEREKKRIETERQKINHGRIIERFNLIKKHPLGSKVYSKLDEEDLAKMDVETVLQKQQEAMAKEAKEQLERLKNQEKRLDHLERAKRQEEIPVIKKYVDEKKEAEKKEWEAHEDVRIAHLIEERKIAVATRDRMKRMKGDKVAFLSSLLESRRHVYEEKLAKFEDDLARQKEERLRERREKRRDERRMEYYQKIEEEERRKEEESRKIEEDKLREEKERVQKEADEKNRITFEKQQSRLREIEERESLDRRTATTASPEKPAVEPWRPSSKPNAEKAAVGGGSTGPAGSGAAGGPAPWVSKRLVERKMYDGSDSPADSPRSAREPDSDREPQTPRGGRDDFEREKPRERREIDLDRSDKSRERRDDFREDRESPRESTWRTAGNTGRERERGPEKTWDRGGGSGSSYERGQPRSSGPPRGGERDRGDRDVEDSNSWRPVGRGERGGDKDTPLSARSAPGASGGGSPAYRTNRDRDDRRGDREERRDPVDRGTDRTERRVDRGDRRDFRERPERDSFGGAPAADEGSWRRGGAKKEDGPPQSKSK